MSDSRCFLFRMIIPAFPRINVFSKAAKGITALGPVLVATSANKVPKWRIEVIDENNYRGLRDKDGLPDHAALQADDPADAVGFYTGLSSTIERVWNLAKFYKSQGAKTIAGAWHAHYMPEETLNHGIDLVVHGDGELIIRSILQNISDNSAIYDKLVGVSYLEEGQAVHISLSGLKAMSVKDEEKFLDELMNSVPDLNAMPFPDFGLLRSARIKWHPIARTRGCGMNCEFCSVRGKARWAGAKHLFNTVKWLVETRGAKRFMIVDDRLEEDIEGATEFFKMVAERFGKKLKFLVQMRLVTAKNPEFLKIMADAGVKAVAIGFESPIDEDLIAMRKGYLAENMLEWTKIIRKYFWIHAMFIFGYPPKDGKSPISAKEMKKRYKDFISKARLQSIQILKAGPGAGTDLRKRLGKQGLLFPLDVVPWAYYDGNWVCYKPQNMTIRELQKIPLEIMKWFYSPFGFFRVCLRTLAFPADYLIRGWKSWKEGWTRDLVKYYGSKLLKGWQGNKESEAFIDKLTKNL